MVCDGERPVLLREIHLRFWNGPVVPKWSLSKPYNMCVSLCKWKIDYACIEYSSKWISALLFANGIFFDSLKILCRSLFVFASRIRGKIATQNLMENLHIYICNTYSTAVYSFMIWDYSKYMPSRQSWQLEMLFWAHKIQRCSQILIWDAALWKRFAQKAPAHRSDIAASGDKHKNRPLSPIT